MPRLRGTFNTGSNLIQMYIDDMFRRGRAEYENQLAGGRQRADDERQFALNTLKGIVDGSVSVEGLQPAALESMKPYYNPTQMSPSILRRAAGLGGLKGDAKLPQDVPSNEAIALQLGGSLNANSTPDLPPEVQAAMDAERARVAPFEPTTSVDFVTEGGDKMQQHFPNSQLSSLGAMKQERTGTQEGQRIAATKIAGDLSPVVTDATIDQTNAINQGTVRTEAMKAGAISGAQTANRLDAELDTDVLNKKFEAAKRIAEMEALLRRDAEALKSQQAMAAALGPLTFIGSRAAELSKIVNTSSPRNIMGRVGGRIGAMMGTDPNAKELDDNADAGGIALASFLGNKGQTSEADKKAGLAFFPTSGLSEESARRRINNFNDLMEVAPFISANPEIPLFQKIEQAKEMIKQRRAARGDATPVEDDETDQAAQSTPELGGAPKRYSIDDPGR